LLLVRQNIEPHATAADLKRDVCALLGVPTAASGSRAFVGGRSLDDAEQLAPLGVPTSPRALRPGRADGRTGASSLLRSTGADERLYPDGWAQGGRQGWCYLRKRDRAWPPERDAESVGGCAVWALVLVALALRVALGGA